MSLKSREAPKLRWFHNLTVAMFLVLGIGVSPVSAGALSDELLNKIRRVVESNWLAPSDLGRNPSMVVTVEFRLNRNGEIEGAPKISGRGAKLAVLKRAFESVRRAVIRSAPFDLPQDQYDSWKDVKLTFQMDAN